ncbi:unnamed protein product, partial [Acanthoscelides obtectus]
STIEKELLAVVYGVKYFKPYLWGREFTIVSDHKPLEYLFNMKEHNPRLLRWKLFLEQFNYKIQYKPGKINSNVDALSRVELNAIQDETDQSIIANLGDSDEDILQFLQDDDNPEINIEDLQELEEFLIPEVPDNSNKIQIISDIQIVPPQPSNDSITVHTAVENPILEIPFTECY